MGSSPSIGQTRRDVANQEFYGRVVQFISSTCLPHKPREKAVPNSKLNSSNWTGDLICGKHQVRSTNSASPTDQDQFNIILSTISISAHRSGTRCSSQ